MPNAQTCPGYISYKESIRGLYILNDFGDVFKIIQLFIGMDGEN